MTNIVICVSFLLLCLISNTGIILSREYYIKYGDIPSYLYHRFDNVSEEVFPADITIKLSLSKVAGTLLYSIDNNMNQLLVSLIDGREQGLHIELNKERFIVSLDRLCECEDCRYQVLYLRIQINEFIRLECNGENVREFSNENINMIYQNHLGINATLTSKSLSINKARMWLVNTPQYPNNNQLYGCIFRVTYHNQAIIFTDFTHNIGPECRETCTDNICNGGQCYDSYNGTPICDCSTTFLNGRYCNDSISPKNYQSNAQLFMFEIIKLSWKSSVDDIFELKNSNRITKIGYEDSVLFFEIRNSKKQNITKRVTLSDKYAPNNEYICIVNFNINNIFIRLFNNGSWNTVLIPVRNDLRREIFDSLKLRSGDGYIDLVHRGVNQYKWRKINIIKYTEIENGSSMILTLIKIVVTVIIGSIVAKCVWGIYIYQKNKLQSLLLVWYNCNFEILRLLKENGANIESRYKIKVSWLKWTCNIVHIEIVRLLTEERENIESRDNNGWISLMHVCFYCHHEIERLYTENEVNIESRDNNKMKLLIIKWYKSHFEIVRLIMENSVNIESRDNNGWTPLMYACNTGNLKNVRLLTKYGANIESRNNDEWTPLMHACYNGHHEIVRLLTEMGANIESRDNDGWTPWDMAR